MTTNKEDSNIIKSDNEMKNTEIKNENTDQNSDDNCNINDITEEITSNDTDIISDNDRETEENEEENDELIPKKKCSMKKQILFEILDFLKDFAIIFIIMMILRSKVFVLACVPTGSMLDTIQLEDRILGNRLAYVSKEPERGDIILFYAPDEVDEKIYIKRLIGLPGDKIVIKDAKIYINDSEKPLNETYLKEEWTEGNDGFEFNVPEGEYFFMGDNRNTSFDARYWNNTYVKKDAIIAKANCIYYPFKDMKTFKKYTDY